MTVHQSSENWTDKIECFSDH